MAPADVATAKAKAATAISLIIVFLLSELLAEGMAGGAAALEEAARQHAEAARPNSCRG
jgi:hypothetical protein